MADTVTVIRRGKPIRDSSGKITGFEKGTSKKVKTGGSRRTVITGSGAKITKTTRTTDESGRITIEGKSREQIRQEARAATPPSPSDAISPPAPEETAAMQSFARRSDLERGFGQTLATQEDLDRGARFEESRKVTTPITLTDRGVRKQEVGLAASQLKTEFREDPNFLTGIKSFGADLTVAGMGAFDLIEGRTKQAAGLAQSLFQSDDKGKTFEQRRKKNPLIKEGSTIISGAVPSFGGVKENPLTALPVTAGLAFELGASALVLGGVTEPQAITSVSKSTTGLRVSSSSAGTTTVGRGAVRVTEVLEQPLLRVTTPVKFGGAGTGNLARTSAEIPFTTIGTSSVRASSSGSRAVTTDFSSDLLVNVGGKQRLLSRTSGVLVDDVGTQVTKSFNIKTGGVTGVERSSIVSRVSKASPSEELFTFRQTTKTGKSLTRSRFEEVTAEDIGGVRVSRGDLVQSTFEPEAVKGLGKKGQISIGRPSSQSSVFDTGTLVDDTAVFGGSRVTRGVTPRVATPARSVTPNLGILDESLGFIKPRGGFGGRFTTGFGATGVSSSFGSVSPLGAVSPKAVSSPLGVVSPLSISQPLSISEPVPLTVSGASSITGSSGRTISGGRGVPSTTGFSFVPGRGFKTPPAPVIIPSLGGGGGFGGVLPKSRKGKGLPTGLPATFVGVTFGVGEKNIGGLKSGLGVRR